jgi:hypothetical protein
VLNIIIDFIKDNTSSLLGIFQEFLDVAPDSSSHDALRQSVIILMGCLAKHLDKDDPKVRYYDVLVHCIHYLPLFQTGTACFGYDHRYLIYSR